MPPNQVLYNKLLEAGLIRMHSDGAWIWTTNAISKYVKMLISNRLYNEKTFPFKASALEKEGFTPDGFPYKKVTTNVP